MSKAVLISVRPKWCELIASGKKTIEVRKTRPKLETPFKCYIYCTKPSKAHQTICGCMVLNSDELFKHPRKGIKYGDSIELMAEDDYTKDNFLNGKVIGEFVCDQLELFTVGSLGSDEIQTKACLSYEELVSYFYNQEELDGNTLKLGYGWHVSKPKIYNNPLALSDFIRPCCERVSDCGNCRKFDRANFSCTRMNTVTRPPQSWMYVEELP